MTDRELLELAAKAAGEDVEWLPDQKVFYRKSCDWPQEKGFFLPLHNDGEALRLAIKLGICIVFMEDHDSVAAEHSRHGVMIIEAMDDFGTRRAIVRAAAEIGKTLP